MVQKSLPQRFTRPDSEWIRWSDDTSWGEWHKHPTTQWSTDDAADQERDRSLLEIHPRGRHGKVLYDLEGDFGIRREDMDAYFGNYMDAFPVEREEPNA